MDWYTWNPKLYLADTLDFTLAEDGAYRRLIDYYMETRAPIPSNRVALCRILGIGQDEFNAIAEQVLSKFTEVDGELHHSTCNKNLDKQDSLSKKRSDIAKAGHKKRHKNKVLHAIAEQKQGNSTHTRQDKTRQDKIEKKEVTNVTKKNDDLIMIGPFELFWDLFPRQRRGNKCMAKSAYTRALKENRATENDILAGLEKYVISSEVSNGYAKGAAAWLNDDKWSNNYKTPNPQTIGQGKQVQDALDQMALDARENQ